MEQTQGYSLYVKTWVALLIVTIIMIGIEMFHLPRALLLITLIAFMLIKAGFIAGNFMHLRFENKLLIYSVIIGILVTGAFMFLLIAADGLHVLNLSSP